MAFANPRCVRKKADWSADDQQHVECSPVVRMVLVERSVYQNGKYHCLAHAAWKKGTEEDVDCGWDVWKQCSGLYRLKIEEVLSSHGAVVLFWKMKAAVWANGSNGEACFETLALLKVLSLALVALEDALKQQQQ